MLTKGKLLLLLINQYHVQPPDAAILTCIAYHESKYNNQAVNYSNTNGSVDYGLFQINSLWLEELPVTVQGLMTQHINIKTAIYIYKKQGVSAWAVSKRCIQN